MYFNGGLFVAFKTLISFLILLIPNIVFAEMNSKIQAAMQNYAKSILKKDFKKIAIKNHPKASRLDISFIVPESWAEQEGDRPNIIKKYKSSVVPDGLQFLISSNPPSAGLENVDFGVLADSDLMEIASEMIPKNSFIVGKEIVHLDGKRTLLIESKNQVERAGLVIYSHNLNYLTFYGNSLVMFAASVGSDTFENASIKMSFFRPIITKVIISVVFNDQWSAKKINQISLSSRSEEQPTTNLFRRFLLMLPYTLPSLSVCFLIAFAVSRKFILALGKRDIFIAFLSSWILVSIVYFFTGEAMITGLYIFSIPFAASFISLFAMKFLKNKT